MLTDEEVDRGIRTILNEVCQTEPLNSMTADRAIYRAGYAAGIEAAAKAFDRGEYDDSKTPRSETLHSDDGATRLHILRAPWGIGSYTFRDPRGVELLARIDAALGSEGKL